MIEVPKDCHPEVRNIAQTIINWTAPALDVTKAITSVVHTRVYLEIEDGDDKYLVQIDKA